MKRSMGRLGIVMITVIATALITTALLSDNRMALSADKTAYRSLKRFNEVLDLIEKNYVETVEADKIIEGAIKGMTSTLDPHSIYMTADMYKELEIETKGSFGGLGITIEMKDSFLTVVAPIEDTPAFKAGILPGDRILKINSESIGGWSITEAVHKLRGPSGTDVTITVMREGLDKPKDFKITRDIIKIKSVKTRRYSDDIGYFRISSFQETTSDELKKALTEMTGGNTALKGLIVDLRNNPGGLLNQSIQVADIFLKSGVIVSMKGRSKDANKVYDARDDGNELTVPMIVLINSGSASAAEIVSGALQDHKRALLVGTQTFGKASAQVVIPLEDGSALKLTTSKYYTPNGRLIQAKGITPDIVMEYQRNSASGEKQTRIREKDLKGHLEGTEDQPEESKTAADGSAAVPDDNQLKYAIDLLKSWDLFARMNRS
ncbi:MAG: S41 family peptidase [Deltaproteobacteria bacterium]|nr:S41 family peptidase [Deltaproteobacteria bacterium]